MKRAKIGQVLKKSGFEDSKSDRQNEGKVEDIVNETGVRPAKAHKSSLTGVSPNTMSASTK